MKDLRAARKSANLTQAELAERTGIEQTLLSKLETGKKSMTETVAERLARHLPGADARAMVFSSKCQSFKAAQESGDRLGVLRAAEAIVKYCDSLPESPELERLLDRLTEQAVAFAEKGSTGPQVYDTYEVMEAEGRDPRGVRKSKFLPEREQGTYPEAVPKGGKSSSSESTKPTRNSRGELR